MTGCNLKANYAVFDCLSFFSRYVSTSIELGAKSKGKVWISHFYWFSLPILLDIARTTRQLWSILMGCASQTMLRLLLTSNCASFENIIAQNVCIGFMKQYFYFQRTCLSFFWLLFFDLLICLSLLFIMCQCFYSLHQFLLIYVFARIVVIVNHSLLIIYFDQSNENWVASEKDKTILRERASISNSSWM